MTEDSRGNVWIASFDHGLSYVSPSGEMRRWTATNGLSYNGTRFLFEDREQNLWVGTSGGGLQRFKPRRFQSYGVANGLTERNVTSVWPDPAGGLWIATYAKGIFRWNDGAITNVPLPPEHNTLDVVNSVLTDRAGRTWFGTWGQGVCVLDARGFRRIPPEQTGGFNILSLFEDSRRRTWAGGTKDVSVGEGDTFRLLEKEPGVSLAGVRCFAEDRESVVWLSNLENVFRYEREHFVEVRDGGAELRDIGCIKTDADGTVWFGSASGGLLCWRSGRFGRIALEAGQPTPGIHGILEDGAGFFWMPSNRGVLRAARKDLLTAANGSGSSTLTFNGGLLNSRATFVTNGQQFAVNGDFGGHSYRLPVYQDQSGMAGRVLLSPLAVTGDVIMVGIVTGVVAAFLWASSGFQYCR